MQNESVSEASNNADQLPLPENKLHYPGLDGFRGIAVLLVFCSHFVALPPALAWGYAGVDLFFVLSGFLITGILYDSQHRPKRFQVFYMRRTLRIFPLYYLVLAAGVLLWPVFKWRLHPAMALWPAYLGNYARFLWPGDVARNTAVFEDLVSTNGHAFSYQLPHLWSLCIEEQFYLLWPMIVFAVRDRVRLRNLCLLLAALVLVLRYVAVYKATPQMIDLGLLYRTLPMRADALLLGGALALALRGGERKRVENAAPSLLGLLVALFAVLEIVSYRSIGHWIEPEQTRNGSALQYTLLALFACGLVLMSIRTGNWWNRLCMWRPLQRLGTRSYGFYVYHLLFGNVWAWLSVRLCLGHRGVASHLLPLVALVGTYAVATLSFNYFEAPFLRLKRFYT